MQKGAEYMNNKDYITALSKYLQILKEIPDDKSILQEIASIYFELKKFDTSYKYYKK